MRNAVPNAVSTDPPARAETPTQGDFTSLVTKPPTPESAVHRRKPTRETATESLARLEREDPAVAAAAASLDRCVDDLIQRAELHRFRPLPWDREARR